MFETAEHGACLLLQQQEVRSSTAYQIVAQVIGHP
jgi:hypothetical protein